MVALQKRALARGVEIEFGHLGERRDVRQEEPAMLPLDEAAAAQALQGLVGVHQGEPDGVGKMLLGEGKAHTPSVTRPISPART